MKHMRITTAHQSITFSRRMMLLSGAQAAVGGVLIGRMGWLAIAQNQTKMEEKVAAVEEAMRQARIFASRAGAGRR